jgi:hypothetical protein
MKKDNEWLLFGKSKRENAKLPGELDWNGRDVIFQGWFAHQIGVAYIAL